VLGWALSGEAVAAAGGVDVVRVMKQAKYLKSLRVRGVKVGEESLERPYELGLPQADWQPIDFVTNPQGGKQSLP
jgi:hypothetical protein